MRRRPWFRALATLLAFWFPLIAGEPGVLHPCPMHGAGAAVAASLLGHAPAGMASHAQSHAAHHAVAHHSEQGGAPGHQHHDCTCINGCCVSLAAVIAPTPATLEVAELRIAASGAIPSAALLPRPAPDFSRPFNTGPPNA